MKCYDCGDEIIDGPYWQARVSEDANTTRPTRQLCRDCFQKTMIVSDEQKGEEMKCEGCGKDIIDSNYCAVPRGYTTEDGLARWHIPCYNKHLDAVNHDYDQCLAPPEVEFSLEGCTFAPSGQKGFTMNLFEYAVVRIVDGEITEIAITTSPILAKDDRDARLKVGIIIGEKAFEKSEELAVYVRPFGG